MIGILTSIAYIWNHSWVVKQPYPNRAQIHFRCHCIATSAGAAVSGAPSHLTDVAMSQWGESIMGRKVVIPNKDKNSDEPNKGVQLK